MESSSLLLAAVAGGGISVLVILWYCCYCCFGKSTERGNGYSRIRTKSPGVFALYDISPLNFFKQHRLLIPPRFIFNFHHFITNTIIPTFSRQRSSGYQFAVLLLLSEIDLANIAHMTFFPHDFWGQPFVDKDYPTMPQDVLRYGNYIVAHPRDNSCHSEEEIFGKYSSIESPFDNLWNTYVEQNHSFPKCILLYTWNLPCSRCTDVIIRSLEESQYHRTSVIVAHTTYWRSESELEHSRNRDKLMNNNISVEQVKYSPFLPPA